MKNQTLTEKLTQVEKDYLMIGYHAEMLESIYNPKYIKFYDLGRQAIRKEIICPICQQPKTDFLDISFIQEYGECLGCDHVRGDINEFN